MASLLSSWTQGKFRAFPQSLRSQRPKYARLYNDDDATDLGQLPMRTPAQRRTWLQRLCATIFLIVIIAVFFATYYVFQPGDDRKASNSAAVHHHHHSHSSEGCRQLHVRREWRTIDVEEKRSYIMAVKCLMAHPSQFMAGTSYYDDFIYAHSKTGVYSHYAAAFLPWHRMYVHLFEKALREMCSYAGPFVYWDWTLDSANLSLSPVWDPVTGFGGNGKAIPLSRDDDGDVRYCVKDGPFADTTRPWKALSSGHTHDVTMEPHCLSRRFTEPGDELLPTVHRLISPERVEKTLSQPDYAAFFADFEEGPHNAIPQFIKGDFLTFTAPNDPVFWLHHTQVDRLWALWQQRNPGKRLKEYGGPSSDFRHHHDEEDRGSFMTDVLPMAGLADDDPMVEDVMDTAGGLLCYRY
ncbi:uncharacterized protein PG986_008532 [Apiospora aurea]|uniref:Tyrosinase copper-binding domain-containing protein n=1 Tax=Apiospora aurea TaxID=335848 RepID=A0ABR1QFP3_9PEZI